MFGTRVRDLILPELTSTNRAVHFIKVNGWGSLFSFPRSSKLARKSCRVLTD